MLSNTINNTTAIRNYVILATSVIVMSVGIADVFNNPARIAQQDRLDNYGRFLSVGLVTQAQKLAR